MTLKLYFMKYPERKISHFILPFRNFTLSFFYISWMTITWKKKFGDLEEKEAKHLIPKQKWEQKNEPERLESLC